MNLAVLTFNSGDAIVDVTARHINKTYMNIHIHVQNGISITKTVDGVKYTIRSK